MIQLFLYAFQPSIRRRPQVHADRMAARPAECAARISLEWYEAAAAV